MSEAVEARLYHNVALLLPDGRVWSSGGGSARATIYRPQPLTPYNVSSGEQPRPITNNIDLTNEFTNLGKLATNTKGSFTVPTETWVAEIFSPPYLFIDGNRRATITSLNCSKADYQFESWFGGDRHYLLHSNSLYDINLTNLPPQCPADNNGSLVLIKLGSATHGWDGGQRLINLLFSKLTKTSLRFRTPDARIALITPAYYMMFYVDCRGKPSVAQMIRFDDQASRL